MLRLHKAISTSALCIKVNDRRSLTMTMIRTFTSENEDFCSLNYEDKIERIDGNDGGKEQTTSDYCFGIYPTSLLSSIKCQWKNSSGLRSMWNSLFSFCCFPPFRQRQHREKTRRRKYRAFVSSVLFLGKISHC